MQMPEGGLEAAIFGASGYAGLELTRLLARHPRVKLAALTSDRWVGESARRAGLRRRRRADLRAQRGGPGGGGRGATWCCLATPAETLARAGAEAARGGRAGGRPAGAFRLKDAALYPRFYGFTHAAPRPAGAGGVRPARAVPRGASPARASSPTPAATRPPPRSRPGAAAAREAGRTGDAGGQRGVGRLGRRAQGDRGVRLHGDRRTTSAPTRCSSTSTPPEIEQTLTPSPARRLAVFTPHLLPMKRGILCTTVADAEARAPTPPR